MSEEGESHSRSDIKTALTTVKPGIAILRFWQGIVDVILRAVVAVSCQSKSKIM